MKLQSYHTDFIKNKAIDLGFISCGISKSGFLSDEVNRFEKWLKNNYHGKMSYMERNFDKRMDTTKLVEGSKSVISLLYNYYPSTKINNDNNQKVASKFQVRGIPTFIIFKNNEVKWRQSGIIEERNFIDTIKLKIS